MNPNDPNDYRVPVLRLGDFFEDEKKSNDPAFGDSTVTGFDWSTAPVATSPADAATDQSSGGSLSISNDYIEDELPEQSATVPAKVPRRATQEYVDVARTPSVKGIPDTNVSQAPVPGTLGIRKDVDEAPGDGLSSGSTDRTQTEGRSSVLGDGQRATPRVPQLQRDTETAEQTVPTSSLTPKEQIPLPGSLNSVHEPSPSADDLSEISATLLSQTKSSGSERDVFELDSANTPPEIRKEQYAPEEVREETDLSKTYVQAKDVWGEFEKKMYPGITRTRSLENPPQSGLPASVLSDGVAREPRTGRESSDDPSSIASDARTLPAGGTEGTVPNVAAVEPPDIWDTPRTSLQDIVLRHIPESEKSTIPTDGRKTMANDTTRTTFTTPSESFGAENAPDSYAQTPPRSADTSGFAQSSQATQQRIPAQNVRNGELAQTDVQSLQHYLGMLDTVPDVEEMAMKLDPTITVAHMRTLQSDIRNGVTFSQPAQPQHPSQTLGSSANAGTEQAAIDPPPSMRTFKRDVEQVIKERGPTILQMVTEQENARSPEDIHIPGISKRISPGMLILFGTAIILVCSSIGIGAWLYLSKPEATPETKPYFLESDRDMSFDMTGKTRSQIMRELVQARDALARSKGEVTRFILTEDTLDPKSNTRVQTPLTTKTFLEHIEARALTSMGKNLDTGFILGVLVQEERVPFVIFLSRYDTQNGEMVREWEPDIAEDLSPFFTFATKAGTDDTEQAMCVLPFQDVAIGNISMRVCKNEAGKTVLAWATFERHIIVTQDINALSTLWERVRVGSLKQPK